jgi:hypothetical protein
MTGKTPPATQPNLTKARRLLDPRALRSNEDTMTDHVEVETHQLVDGPSDNVAEAATRRRVFLPRTR